VYKNRLIGVLYLENALIAGAFTRDRMEAIGILLAQIAVSIDNATLFAKERAQAEELARYQNHLEDLVEERTRELKAMQSRLVEVSRHAGMAEIASGVLHNVGNSLNSVNVAAEVIDRKLQDLHVSALTRVLDLLAAQDDLAAFIRDDARGRQAVPYLCNVKDVLVREREELRTECQGLRERIGHIKVVVAQQQAHARAVAVIEPTTVQELVHEALALVRPMLGATTEVVAELEALPSIAVDRHGVLQILVNLLRNAGQAVESTGRGRGRIRIVARASEVGLDISVDDDGVGVPPENMDRIFGYGFTTKTGGHGFGLHNSCNMARTMGGDLRCESEGVGRGAAFTLTLPMQKAA
jgi:signal transduction histidine kinase